MAIDNLPQLQNVIEQTGLLERLFQDELEPRLAYRPLAARYLFPNGIGETITKTRPALFPFSSYLPDLNPSSNTGLDNGLTDSYYGFEQFVLSIGMKANTTSVNIEQDRTLIQRAFLQNVRALGQNAGAVLDASCAQSLHTSYDSGNTFASAAAISGATSVSVDNANGFDTVYGVAPNSPGAPVAVSVGNKMTCTVYDKTTGASKGTIQVSAVAFDGSNTSTAQQGGVVYGRSGVLTVVATTFAIAQGDNIVASDGCVVLRPNAKLSRFGLANTDTLSLLLLGQAKAKLEARAIPKLPNGMYCAIVDPLLWPQLMSDTAFQRATATQMGQNPYFRNGILAPAFGLEFVPSNMVPAFALPAAGAASGAGVARHIMVAGREALIEGVFSGALDAAGQARSMQNSDIRIINDVVMITRAPLDRLQQQIVQSWKWTGGHTVTTDVTSTPAIIPTTDTCRYKRCVSVEVYNAN